MITKFKKPVAASGTTTENEPIIKSDGASSNVMQWLSNDESSNITISEDGSNNLDLVVSAGNATFGGAISAGTGSANYWTLNGNATGQPVYVNATGSDTNIGFDFNSKGIGNHRLNVNGITRLNVSSTGLAVAGQVAITSTSQPMIKSEYNAEHYLGIGHNYIDLVDDDYDNDLELRTGGTARLTIGKTTGLATFSNGIAFQSATTGSGTGTGYTLDSYEVGTFTPVLTGSISGTASGNGQYTKIGRLVTIRITVTAATAALDGNITITGLPFSPAISSTEAISTAFEGYRLTATGTGTFIARIVDASTAVGLYELISDANAATLTAAANFQNAGNHTIRVLTSYTA